MNALLESPDTSQSLSRNARHTQTGHSTFRFSLTKRQLLKRWAGLLLRTKKGHASVLQEQRMREFLKSRQGDRKRERGPKDTQRQARSPQERPAEKNAGVSTHYHS